MARVTPPGNRATVSDDNEGLVVSVPARRRMLIVLFLGFWLCGWVMGEVTVIHQLVTGETGDEVFLIVWLCGWTVGGAFAITAWLWNVAGVERIWFTSAEIRIRRGVGGIGLSKEYDFAHASGLRAETPALNWGDPRSSMRFWGLGGGALAFDYGSATIRFGGGLEDSEARQLVDRITARFPALKSRA